jgi:isochorismate hydrolase
MFYKGKKFNVLSQTPLSTFGSFADDPENTFNIRTADLTGTGRKSVKKNKPFDPNRALLVEHGMSRYFRDVFDAETQYADLKDKVTYKERLAEAFRPDKYDEAAQFLAANPELVDIFRILVEVMDEVPTQYAVELYRRLLPSDIEQRITERRNSALARKKAEYEEKQAQAVSA